jgi:hypothetical protein
VRAGLFVVILMVMWMSVRRMSVRPVTMVMCAAGRARVRMGTVFVMIVVVCMIGMRCMSMFMFMSMFMPVTVFMLVVVMRVRLSIKRCM